MKNSNLKVVKGDNLPSSKIDQVSELYTPIKKLPSPSFKHNLNDSQKYWYSYFGEQLVLTGKLTKPDLFHLHRLARSVERYLLAEKEIDDLGYYGGLVQKTPNNYYQISAHVTVRDKCLADIEKVSQHFGFSFLDRKKLALEKKDDNQTSLFKELERRLAQ